MERNLHELLITFFQVNLTLPRASSFTPVKSLFFPHIQVYARDRYSMIRIVVDRTKGINSRSHFLNHLSGRIKGESAWHISSGVHKL